MGDKTGIEWTDATWNPTTGCDRVSPGCDSCYAATVAARNKLMEQGRMAQGATGPWRYQNDGDPVTSGPGFKLTLHPDTGRLEQPLRWKRPRRIFVNSMSDLFHKDVPDEFIARVWDVMVRCPQHTFQILTKRPQRLRTVLGPNGTGFYAVDGPVPCPQPNVLLGTSIETDRYSFRANHLREAPAVVRFLSCEPLLGPLPSLNLDGIGWVIVGGESGQSARPMDSGWARDIRDMCAAADVPFFMKQMGTNWARANGMRGKAHELDELPFDLQIREEPVL